MLVLHHKIKYSSTLTGIIDVYVILTIQFHLGSYSVYASQCSCKHLALLVSDRSQSSSNET